MHTPQELELTLVVADYFFYNINFRNIQTKIFKELHRHRNYLQEKLKIFNTPQNDLNIHKCCSCVLDGHLTSHSFSPE